MHSKKMESGNHESRRFIHFPGLKLALLPALTDVLLRIRPVGFPIYVAPPGGSIPSLLPSQFYLLSIKSVSWIPGF